MSRRRLVALALVIVVAIGGLATALAVRSHPSGPTPAQIAAARARRLMAEEARDATRAEQRVALGLPRNVAAEPLAPNPLFREPLGSREVVGYVPYWTLPELSAADYADATVLCFYGVSLTGAGALLTSGPEWGNASATLHSSAFSNFVSTAHAAQDRVLLSLATANDAVIAALLRHPAAAANRAAASLGALVRAEGLDGVNVDIEGDSSSDRGGFVRFARDLTAALRKDDPGGELLLDSYGGAAGNPPDFFDVARLAPLFDAVFVEGYDMNEPHVASATAPLDTPNLGYSDVQTLIQYEKVMPLDKLVLGMPFYGYDFTTRRSSPGAKLTSADPEAVTYGAVASVGRPANWQPVADTPFTSFRLDGHDHETYYDDPTSLAIKSALATEFHLLGVGAWAFGMEGGDAAMLEALAGGSPVVKLPLSPATGVGG